MEGKDEGKRAECLLPTRQVGDVLPALLGWTHTEDYPLREGVKTVHQLQLSITSLSDHLHRHRHNPLAQTELASQT